MILAQIEEWFHASLAGIRRTGGDIAYGELVIQPKLVGDLRHVRGSYETPQGTARSSWARSERRFELKVTVPANTTAEVWVPSVDGDVHAPSRATYDRTDGDYTVYAVPAGEFTFRSTTQQIPTAD
jgi:alpha-L-rhamnosidase